MSSITTVAPAVKPADVLVHRLLMQGWHPGAPGTLSEQSRKIDQQFCAESVCPGCNWTGLKYMPFRRAGRYRVCAICPICGTAEER